MSDPSFQNTKNKLESHLRVLISQPIREFQEEFEVKINAITIELLGVPDYDGQKALSLVQNIKITLE